MKTAKKAAARLLSFYPPVEALDPEAFIAGLTAIMAQYPPLVLERAIDPVKGLPARVKALRSLAVIRQELDEIAAPFEREARREQARREAASCLPVALEKRSPAQQAQVDAQVANLRAVFGLTHHSNKDRTA
jgi:hypothetical protein